MKTCVLIFSAVTLAALAGAPAMAQQTTGVPGSPSATTTLKGNQIPAPEPKFDATAEELSITIAIEDKCSSSHKPAGFTAPVPRLVVLPFGTISLGQSA